MALLNVWADIYKYRLLIILNVHAAMNSYHQQLQNSFWNSTESVPIVMAAQKERLWRAHSSIKK